MRHEITLALGAIFLIVAASMGASAWLWWAGCITGVIALSQLDRAASDIHHLRQGVSTLGMAVGLQATGALIATPGPTQDKPLVGMVVVFGLLSLAMSLSRSESPPHRPPRHPIPREFGLWDVER